MDAAAHHSRVAESGLSSFQSFGVVDEQGHQSLPVLAVCRIVPIVGELARVSLEVVKLPEVMPVVMGKLAIFGDHRLEAQSARIVRALDDGVIPYGV